MKFYNMTSAADSMVRVGQDLADEFIGMKDYDGAKQVMEQHVLPVVNSEKLVKRLVQVRSQYAVILALCGQHDDAGAEMRSLGPYFDGLSNEQRQEIEGQSNYIRELKQSSSLSTNRNRFKSVGRNERCPCGSGLKYKKCHGV
jgi:uncharacterized protein YecA (UPF0149 family)